MTITLVREEAQACLKNNRGKIALFSDDIGSRLVGCMYEYDDSPETCVAGAVFTSDQTAQVVKDCHNETTIDEVLKGGTTESQLVVDLTIMQRCHDKGMGQTGEGLETARNSMNFYIDRFLNGEALGNA